MIDVDKAVLARLKIGGKNFEVLVDCNTAIELKEGKSVDISDVLAAPKIFSNASKGLLASEQELQKLFGSNKVEDVARQIIKNGEVQLTAEYRKKLREEKKRRIIDIIHRNGVDPRTKLPHPPQRIENAFDETRIHIDEFRPAEEQAKEIIKKLRAVLPITFEKREIAVKLPSQYAGSAYQHIRKFGEIKKEEWQNDGSLIIIIEIPAGLRNEFVDKLNSLTKAEAEIRVIK